MTEITPTVLPRRRASLWLWALLVLVALTILVVMGIVGVVVEYGMDPIDVIVEGERFTFDLSALDEGEVTGLVVLLFFTVFILLVVVPLVVLAVLAIALLATVFGVAMGLLAAAAGTILALSPFILLALFARWIWRISSSSSAPGSSSRTPPQPPATIGR